jgi:hypothetical protein
MIPAFLLITAQHIVYIMDKAKNETEEQRDGVIRAREHGQGIAS